MAEGSGISGVLLGFQGVCASGLREFMWLLEEFGARFG